MKQSIMELQSMNCFEHQVIGYHGSKQNNIKEILRCGKFRLSDHDNEWLGKGVYFFERDIYQAINWCARARQYNNWSVIEALIDVENLIDLTLTEHYDKVDKLFEILEDKFENDINRSKKLTRKELFDILYSINQYDGIRSYFKVPKGGCIGKKVASHIKRVHVQLCVRNHDCIICFEEVDKGEY